MRAVRKTMPGRRVSGRASRFLSALAEDLPHTTSMLRLRRAVASVDAAADQEAHDLALHESRKAAKRLRYAAEAARPILGKDAKRRAPRQRGHRSVLRQLAFQAQREATVPSPLGCCTD
jgi:CHAD domain-containing protein